MATLYTQQDSNIRKTWLLMTSFLVGVIGIGFVFSQIYQNSIILYVLVIFSFIMSFVSYWYSDKIALKSTGAIPADEQRYMQLHRMVENLARTAGLPKPRVYIIPDRAPNAFATGRNKEHAAVAFTAGILDLLDESELEGVVAHELAHIGNRDILLATVVVVLVGFVSLLADIFLRSTLIGNSDSENKNSGIFIIIGIALSILAPIAAMIIQLAVSRKREFLADATGALLTRYPEGLANALKKISTYNRPMQKASDATAHLFIANPFGGKKGIHKLFMTHPPVEERIEALMRE
jgi:heat shock protein HtpX